MEEDLSRQFSNLGVERGLGDEQPDDVDDDQDFNDDTSANCNLIVNYLPHDIDDSGLRDLFAQYGEILMTKVVRDKNTKKSLGYGFVKFLKEDDAVYAIDKMNGFSLAQKNLKVSIARPPSLEIRNCKLYVTNLPKEYTEREVVSLFKEFGDIIECRVLKDRNSRSNKGVAFVQFNLKSQANNALSLNGCQLEGSSRGLVVKYAEDQHKKKEMSRLQTLTTNGQGGGGGHNNGQGGGYGGGTNRPQSQQQNYQQQQQYQQQGQQQYQQQQPYGGGGGNYPNQQQMQHPGMGGGGGGGDFGQGGAAPPNHHKMRLDGINKPQPLMNPQQQAQMQQQQQQAAFYYQQQQGMNAMYASGMGSPLQMLSPLNSPQLSVYMPPYGSVPTMLDYSPSNMQRPARGRKNLAAGFPLDIPQAEQMGLNGAPGSGGSNGNSNWYSSMPPHMSFLASPNIGLPQQPHSPLSMSGLSPLQQQAQAAQHMSMAMLGSPMMGSPVIGGNPQGLMYMHQMQNQNGSGSPIDPQQVAAAQAQQAQYSGSVTLNIVNLPAQADVALLHDLFSPYGRILSAQIDVDTAGGQHLQQGGGGPGRVSVCSGRGRVQMAGLPQAEYAAQALNGAVIADDGMPIQVSLSFG